jgi:hypothetical protein
MIVGLEGVERGEGIGEKGPQFDEREFCRTRPGGDQVGGPTQAGAFSGQYFPHPSPQQVSSGSRTNLASDGVRHHRRARRGVASHGHRQGPSASTRAASKLLEVVAGANPPHHASRHVMRVRDGSRGETLAALQPACLDDGPTSAVRHPVAEPVSLGSPPVIGLVGTLHYVLLGSGGAPRTGGCRTGRRGSVLPLPARAWIRPAGALIA